MIKLTRNQVIQSLVDSDMEIMDAQLLRFLLRNGITGYKNLSNEELKIMYDHLALSLDANGNTIGEEVEII